MTMKIDRHILSVIVLMSVFAPAVKADLIADPKEFNVLKNLTGQKRKDRSISPRPKYESVTGERSNAKPADKTASDSKTSGKTEAKTEVNSDAKSKTDNSKAEAKSDTKSDSKSGDKSSEKSVAKTK